MDVAFGPLRFESKRTHSGMLACFPEQAANWAWIRREGERGEGRRESEGGRGAKTPHAAEPELSRRQHYLGRSYSIMKNRWG